MEFFLHYVGQDGSARDFPKTVFTKRPTSLVLQSVPDRHPQKGYLLQRLLDAFPSGRWNCWGVPDKAAKAIRKLSEGSIVLLMETSSGRGSVPALGRVVVYVPQRFPALSQALWGDRGFPYIFFFETLPLSLTWEALRSKLGYDPNFQGSRGHIQRLAEVPVGRAGGPVELERWLLEWATPSPPDSLSLDVVAEGGTTEQTPYDAQSEYDSLITASIQHEPELTDNVEAVETISLALPRSRAFRLGIRRLYGGRCAICDLSLSGPAGEVEVQSAHIYPRHLKGRDDFRNGLCLCRMHHWALDVGWIALSDKNIILVRDGLPRHRDYDFIREYEARAVREPVASHFSPHPRFTQAHRELYGFDPLRRAG